MNLLLENICTSISGLTITGVDILDTDEVTPSFAMHPNVLYPNVNPPGFVTAFHTEYVSILRGTGAPADVGYTLNYRFLGPALGDSLTIGAAYGAVVSKLADILGVILDTATVYSGKVTLEPGEISIGMKMDPAGNMYHGADFALVIVEHQ